MVDAELQKRLDRVTELLGQKVTLVEPAPETKEEPEPEASSAANSQQRQEDRASEPKKAEAPQVELEEEADAPKRFFSHDVGPRAKTQDSFDNSRFVVGEPIEASMDFCPWKVVTAYPYTFVGNTNRPHVEPLFDKIFEGRVWDFFYIYHPTRPAEKPYLLVPTSQFQSFLDKVNKVLGISLCIPAGPPSERFFLRFGQGGTPRPRYFKRFTDEKFDVLPKWPDINVQDAEDFTAASGICQEDLSANLRLCSAPPSKGKYKNNKKSEQKKLDRAYMLEETQTLLALADSRPLRGIKGGYNIVFVAMDVEAIERPPNPISEVGIAVLDTGDMRGTDPGPCGQRWHSSITAHHLRTREYSALINHQFIQGCPDHFNFGKSTFPPKETLPNAIMDVLNPYIEADRDIILVGHDTKQDIQYLASIGVDLFGVEQIRRTLDTQAIHQAWKKLDNVRGLSGVLGDLGLKWRNLHNAGNDAVYTLHALIGVSIEEIRQRKIEAKGGEYKPLLWEM